jgi:hypothetical protein
MGMYEKKNEKTNEGNAEEREHEMLVGIGVRL